MQNLKKSKPIEMFRSIMLGLFTVLFISLVLAMGACSRPPVGSQEQSRQVAEEFVKMEATFRFDGMPNTFKLGSTTSVTNGWSYSFEFDSQNAGYGNRTGQVLAPVVTHHTALVTVQAGKVTAATMDGKWNMLKGQEVNL